MKRIHIVGKKNSGKTTLIVELIELFTARGFRVATVKHTHHRHELDTPGKDSFRHRQAGAVAVGILSRGMIAVFRPTPLTAESADRYALFAATFADCDFVLVEGDSQTTAIKIEVWRAEIASEPMAKEDAAIRAVITDDDARCNCPLWPRSDLGHVADELVALLQNE